MNFDYDKLLSLTGGDEELASELIGIFKEECPGMLDSIEQAIRDNQPRQLHEAAHKLKGSLANMGAYAAFDQVVVLETMGINEDLQKAGIALEKLRECISELMKELNTHKGVIAE